MITRTRFAPSPTGFLHVGSIRTALYAWLTAKQEKGQFILRIEDTDQSREVEGSIDHIMKSLQWLGLQWDEGPDIGGTFGPYKQSERLSIYKEWAEKLLESGRAYVDPYSVSELEELRKKAKAENKPFLFREYRPNNKQKWDGTKPLRFLSDPKPYEWRDEVMGNLRTGPEVIDDFIIMKSDGFPTYNFAHIIDDYLMEITHIFRSQEFIASVPKFLNLYEALNIERPKLATLPFVMGPDGKKKLSKRDVAKDVLDYAREGYLPEALINFLATLGWSDGTDQEIFSVDELIQKFDLSHVHKGGARFDERRLQWMDGVWARKLSIEDLLNRSDMFWPDEAKDFDETYKKNVLLLVQERLKYLGELPDLTRFFFVDLPVNESLAENNKRLSGYTIDQRKALLEKAYTVLETNSFSIEDLTNSLNQLLTDTQETPAVLFSLIRIATTESPASPGLAETLALLGKETSLRRLKAHIDSYK